MINEYLKLLGLNKESLTLEELNKAYRREMHKYHPDLIKESGLSYDEANEKAKKINVARDYLENYIKGNQPGYSHNRKNNNSNFIEYKTEICEKIVSYIIDLHKVGSACAIILNCNLSQYIKLINNIKLKLESSSSIEDVKEIYQSFLEVYKDMLKNIKKHYFEYLFISDEDVKEELNYDLPLINFMNKLASFKIKYSKKYAFKIKINNARDTFLLYPHFKNLENIINKYIDKHMELGIKSKFNNPDLINEFTKAVSDLFERYEKFLSRINELLEKCKIIFGEDIIEKTNGMLGYGYDTGTRIVSDILRIRDNYTDNPNENIELDQISDRLNTCSKDSENYNKLKKIREVNRTKVN